VKVAVIINPIAGAARGRRSPATDVERAWRLLKTHGADGDISLTERPGHATEVARDRVAGGCALIVAWGGDGTVNEVASALVNQDAALGIVPGGSGNGLARELGVPRDPEAALRLALTGRERTIDAGEIGGRLFFNLAGLGFDAVVARRFNEGGRRGVARYAALTLRELWRYEGARYTVTCDGERPPLEHRALMLVLANSRQYGAGALIAPDARVDDGRLDLVVIDTRHPVASLWNLPRLFTGSLGGVRGVLMRPVRHVAISSSAPIPLHVDGEHVTAGASLSARVLERVLRVRTRPGGA